MGCQLATRSSDGRRARSTITIERGPVTPLRRGGHRVEPDLPAAPTPPRRPGSTTSPCRRRTSSPPPRTGVPSPRTSRPTPRPRSNPTMEIIGKLMAKGGMVLHGEQEFTYHRPVVVGRPPQRGQGRRPLREATRRPDDDVPRHRERVPRRDGRAGADRADEPHPPVVTGRRVGRLRGQGRLIAHRPAG